MGYKSFQYELRNAKTERDLGSIMKVKLTCASQDGPYKEGDIVPLTDGVIEQNNKKHVCDYRIVSMSRDNHEPWKYVAYIKKVECWEPSSTGGVDWEGLDGWLKLSSD